MTKITNNKNKKSKSVSSRKDFSRGGGLRPTPTRHVATRSQGPLDDELSVDSASVSSNGTGNGRLDDLALIEVIIDFLSSITDIIGMGGANGIGTVIFRRAFLTFSGGLDSALSGLGENLVSFREDFKHRNNEGSIC